MTVPITRPHPSVLRPYAAVHPLGDRITVRPDPEVSATDWGLLLVSPDERRPHTATVVEVGPDAPDVRPGDRVLVQQWGGLELETADGTLLLMPARDVFGVLGQPD